MKKIVLTMMFLFTFTLPVYAEIAYFQNEFTDSKVIVSSIDRDKKTSYSKAPNNITLRKELLNNNTNFTLIILTTKSSIPAILDKTHFKFNNTKVMSLKTSVDPDSYSLFFELNDDLLKLYQLQLLSKFKHQCILITKIESNTKNTISYQLFLPNGNKSSLWNKTIYLYAANKT